MIDPKNFCLDSLDGFLSDHPDRYALLTAPYSQVFSIDGLKALGEWLFSRNAFALVVPDTDPGKGLVAVSSSRKCLENAFVNVGNSSFPRSPFSPLNGVDGESATRQEYEAIELDCYCPLAVLNCSGIPFTPLVFRPATSSNPPKPTVIHPDSETRN